MKNTNKKQEEILNEFREFVKSNQEEKITISQIRVFLFKTYLSKYSEMPEQMELFEMTEKILNVLPYEGKSLSVEKMWKN